MTTTISTSADAPMNEDARRASLAAAEFAEPKRPPEPLQDVPATDVRSLPMRRLAAGEFGAW